MPIDPQSLYLQLGQLVAATPSDLAGPGPVSPEAHAWLGRAAALIEAQLSTDELNASLMMDRIALSSAVNNLAGVLREAHAHEIVAIVHRALARAEMKAPAAARGAFIGVGAAFNAIQAISKVLKEAKKEVLFVDAYMDATVLTDFAALASENIAIRVLGDAFSSKPETLRPAAERWMKQFGNARPLEVRLSAPRALHDRLIIVDAGAQVWNLSQSFNHLVARSPASIVRLDADIAAQKRDYYLPLWSASTPL